MISFNYWREHFASDPSTVGQTILINTIPFTVIGVSAPGFFGIDSSMNPAVFLPLHALPVLARNPGEEERARFLDPNFYWLEMMGRLRPGVGPEQAQAVFGSVFHRFTESTATTEKERAVLPEFHTEAGAGGRDTLRRMYAKPLYVLMAMVGLILLIACANIANLLLARSAARRREIATRLSLGASRARVIRQLLTESVLLSLAGGLVGIGVAIEGIRSITWLLSDGREGMMLRAGLDWPVLAFTAGLAVVAGLLFGLAPAIQSTRGDLAPALKEARIGASRGRSRIGLSQILVTAQIAISLLLVVAAGLFVRTLNNLHSIALGFNRENLLIFRVNARDAGYKDEALAKFYARLADRFRGIAGVRSASLSDVPLVAHYINNLDVTIPGQPSEPGTKRDTCVLRVDQGFFETMQIPVLLGRGITKRDVDNPRGVVVSELFAKKFFPGENAVGRRIRLEVSPADIEIVGIAKTTLYNSLREETPPVVYLPYTFQLPFLQGVWFELRTAGDPLKLATSVRRIVHEAAATVPVTNVKTQAAQIDETISPERTFADLCTCFAALALIIACVGLYGMTAYSAARRTSEIGIRMALGAGRAGIVWMMLRQVLILSAIGLAIGLAIAWETAHVVASFLYGVKPQDPVAIWGAAAVLLTSAIFAAYGPARRAARIDPMTALRNE